MAIGSTHKHHVTVHDNASCAVVSRACGQATDDEDQQLPPLITGKDCLAASGNIHGCTSASYKSSSHGDEVGRTQRGLGPSTCTDEPLATTLAGDDLDPCDQGQTQCYTQPLLIHIRM